MVRLGHTLMLFQKSSGIFSWLSSLVSFQMCPQTVCPSGCIVTVVAFVWLFSTMGFQMSPQITCLNKCKITYIAFVWLFSSVSFKMFPQRTWIRACKITLVAFVWLFATVYFHMCPQMAIVRGRIIALVAFVQLHDIFCEDFHILVAQVMIFKSFVHSHSLHLAVLLPVVISWYWDKSEVQEDIRSVGKGKVEMVIKATMCLEYQIVCSMLRLAQDFFNSLQCHDGGRVKRSFHTVFWFRSAVVCKRKRLGFREWQFLAGY